MTTSVFEKILLKEWKSKLQSGVTSPAVYIAYKRFMYIIDRTDIYIYNAFYVYLYIIQECVYVLLYIIFI